MKNFVIILMFLPVLLFAQEHAFIGVFLENLSPEELTEKNIEYGVRITKIAQNSPAEEYDLEADMIILKLDGKPAYNQDELKKILSNYKPEDKIKITVLDDAKKKDIKLVLGSSKPLLPTLNSWFLGLGNFEQGHIGIDLQELTGQLANYFDVESGVLITEVFEDSPAEKAKLKAGDIITKIDKKTVGSIEELRDELREKKKGDELKFHINRKSKKITKTVILKEDINNGFYFEFDGDNNAFYFGTDKENPTVFSFDKLKFYTDSLNTEGLKADVKDKYQKQIDHLQNEIEELKKMMKKK